MAKKKVSIEEKIEEIIANALDSKWCVVDTDNVFSFMGYEMKIHESVNAYKVFNKPVQDENGEWNDWTNDALNVMILAVDDGEQLRFFKENLGEIDALHVKILN